MKQRIYLSPEEGGGKGGDGAGASAGEGKGAGDGKAGGDAKVVTLTQPQLDAMLDSAMGRGIGKLHKALGVKDDAEAEELIRLGREARTKNGGDSKASDGGAAPADIKSHVDAAVERVTQTFRKQLEDKDGELSKQKEITQRFAVDNAITFAASKKSVVNTEHVVRLLRDRARVSADGTTVEVLDERGNVAYGKDGKPLSVEVFVSEWLEANPHFLPAGVKPGAGAGSSPGGGTNAGGKTITRADFERLAPAERVARINEGFRVVD